MTPTGSDTGARNADLVFQIQAWARATSSWKGFDSSTGLRLPNNSVLSPDAALVALDCWQALTAEQRCGFAPLCPALVARAPATKAPGVSPPCAKRWPHASAMAPASAGC
jgi:Uma2 family endonuclease